nr:MAG TPA: Glycine rich protein family [Caudoviricetes sp.]
MFILIWIIIVMALLIFAAISEHEIAKQDEEWMKESKEKNQWKKK